MADNKIINVFVSHFHEDESNVKTLKNLVGDSVTLKNSSVTSDKFNRAHNPEYIKKTLRGRIDWAAKFVCLIGPNTHDSEWVKYEIEYAHKMGKPIVGVFVRGAKDSDIPDALNDYASSIVGWNKDSVLKAFQGEGIFVNSDGSTRSYAGSKDRSIC